MDQWEEVYNTTEKRENVMNMVRQLSLGMDQTTTNAEKLGANANCPLSARCVSISVHEACLYVCVTSFSFGHCLSFDLRLLIYPLW